MLLVTMTDATLIGRNKRIVISLVEKVPDLFLPYLGKLLASADFNDEVYQFLNNQFSSLFMNSELSTKCWEVMTRLLYQLSDSGNIEQFLNEYKQATRNLQLTQLLTDDFLYCVVSGLEGILYNRKHWKSKHIVTYLEITQRVVRYISAAQVQKYRISQILLRIASAKPLFNLICMQILM